MIACVTSLLLAPLCERRLNGKSPRRPHTAEADGVAALAGPLATAVRRAAGVGPVGPRAAAQHALLRPLLVPRAAVGRGALVVVVPGVRRPLPDVAVHVVQAPGVRLLLAHRRVLALGVAVEPGVLLQAISLVPEGVL